MLRALTAAAGCLVCGVGWAADVTWNGSVSTNPADGANWNGGVAPTVLRLPRTESFLTGKSFSLGTLEDAGAVARDEIAPISDVRGTRDFRLQLAENVLRKFYYDVAGDRAV